MTQLNSDFNRNRWLLSMANHRQISKMDFASDTEAKLYAMRFDRTVDFVAFAVNMAFAVNIV